jgi:hypothetical protein
MKQLVSLKHRSVFHADPQSQTYVLLSAPWTPDQQRTA